MYRRLYFLFPSPGETHVVVEELESMGVDEADIHAYSPHTKNLSLLPDASTRQNHDTASLLEKILWNTNLAVFFVALVIFVASLYFSAWGWTAFSSIIMLLTYGLGYYFTSNIPNTHLDEFKSAMAHDEILLSIDVPKNKMTDVDKLIHYRHLEAINGGVSWSLHALGL